MFAKRLRSKKKKILMILDQISILAFLRLMASSKAFHLAVGARQNLWFPRLLEPSGAIS